MGIGRKRKSAAEHKLNGNPGRREIRPEPEFKVVKGSMPPDWLDEIACKEWHSLMPVLERTHVMTEGDLTAFAAYCYHYSCWRRMIAKQAESGDIHVNQMTGAVHPSPYDNMVRQHSALMKSYLSEFGLTPATRSKVALVKDGGKRDEFEEDFGE